MLRTSFLAFIHNFLGNSPQWFKISLISFLILNPILLYATGPYVTGWVFVAEFIFILAMALQCYPLPPAGLLALQAVILRLTSAETVYKEVSMNLPVILLLVFMVAAIYFMKDFLRVVFTSILLRVRSKVVLSLLFLLSAAFLSAFLDALTVTAVIISVAYGFYDLYHRYVSGKHDIPCDLTDDSECREESRIDLQEFRGFLRNLVMHAAVGTALGGVATLVGEPQNLLIGTVMNWNFATFFFKVAPVSMPVLAMGIATCLVLERLHLFGYGRIMSESVRYVLQKQSENETRQRSARAKAGLAIQAVGGVFLILALGFHLAEVGLIGLTLLVLLTALNGINEEHRIGRAFEEALPFTSLLVVFFCIVAVIHDQHLFRPVTQFVLTLDGQKQLAAYYLANGFLSMISDNVFVATVYISEAAEAFKAGAINREQFDLLAVAINTGTNIPSVATPNGQAAFLFLLTSALAPVIRLSYGRMVLLALPYTVTMTLTGLAAIWWFL